MISVRSLFLSLCLCLCAALTGSAQQLPRLAAIDIEITTQPDGFAGETRVVTGEIFNHGSEPYSKITISIAAYDSADSLIGEGFGFLVDACGTALLEFDLSPGLTQSFSAPFELFAEGEVARIQATVAGEAADPPARQPLVAPAVTHIASGEVVMLEWLDETSLIYAVGCDEAVFTELEWRRYDLNDERSQDISHPDAARVSPAMLERSGVAMITQSGAYDPQLYYSSRLTFPPSARRVVFQNDLHTIFSAEPDGSFPRLIHDKLHQRSLRGFNWSRGEGIFLAYYFGAFGEPVHYFSADVDGRVLMGPLDALPPSETVPGLTDDGRSAIVGLRQGETSGYYLINSYGGRERLFEADLPGNNYPAPVVDGQLVYVIRPIDDGAALQCFNRRTGGLQRITNLPLRLVRESRGFAWLSPGGTRLAVASNGTAGGLWLVDVAGACGA